MANLRIIKNKINTVKSIKKIFSVMQLIASSKMKRAQDDVKLSNAAIIEIKDMFLRALDNNSDVNAFAKLNIVDKNAPELYILIASDRGLCGNYNSLILKKSHDIFKKNTKQKKIIVIGNKIRPLLMKQYSESIDLKHSEKFDEFFRNHGKIINLLNYIFSEYQAGSISACHIVYVFSKNAMIKTVKEENLFFINELKDLISTQISENSEDSLEKLEASKETIIYEKNKESIVSEIIDYYLKAKFFNFFRNSYFSELASRMVAMDSANRNAGEIQKKLVLTYNKKRQANITSDLIDIINGAENI